MYVPCLKAPDLIDGVDSLTMNSGATALCLMPEGCLSNTHIFLCKAHHSCPALGALHGTLALCLGAILQIKISKKPPQNAKYMARSRLQKDTNWHPESGIKKAELCLLQPQLEHTFQSSQSFATHQTSSMTIKA